MGRLNVAHLSLLYIVLLPQIMGEIFTCMNVLNVLMNLTKIDFVEMFLFFFSNIGTSYE